jgi:general L-amino acid transport system permease protein
VTRPPWGRRRSAVPPWRDARALAAAGQILVLLSVLAVGGILLANLASAMQSRDLYPSLDFLGQRAGFEISETSVEYGPSSTYADAFTVGLLNTLLVSVVAIVLASIAGIAIGIARLSRNWLVNRLALGYVELFRNTPLLVQLFVIYFAVLQLPPVREAIALPGGVFLTQRGVYLPRPQVAAGVEPWLLAIAVALAAASSLWAVGRRRAAAGWSGGRAGVLGLALLLGVPAAAWWVTGPAAGPPITFDLPEQGRFNFSGGLAVSPEFAALTVGLALYTAAFIAEIVRGGIQAVPRGQSEAARSIGLSEAATLRHVVLPQALRIIVPPLTSQYLNLVKNSSLALAIGYADLFNISNTISSQTGEPVAVIAVVMAIYLAISLLTSAAMSVYNRRVQLVGG